MQNSVIRVINVNVSYLVSLSLTFLIIIIILGTHRIVWFMRTEAHLARWIRHFVSSLDVGLEEKLVNATNDLEIDLESTVL